MRRLLPLLAAALLVLVPTRSARAQLALAAPSPLAELRAAIGARWGVPAGAVHLDGDSTLAGLTALGAPLRLGAAGFGGRFVVHAGSHSAWIRAGVLARLPVAARPLARGATIHPEDVRIESRVRWGEPNRADTVVSGWSTARHLPAGSVLLPPAVRPATAVRAGDAVKVVLEHGPVRLQLLGSAGGTGAIGDTISIRAQSGKRLRGVIREPGTVFLVGTGEEP
jgi:flagella basal body P-ring formation protein FlgA